MNPSLGFDFRRPDSVGALLSTLSTLMAEGCDFRLAAGTTDLMPQMKNGVVAPDIVLSLNGIEALHGIEWLQSGACRIGSLTRLAQLATDARLTQHYPALALAASKVASAPIRERATLGGNILVDNRCNFINQSALNRMSHGLCFKAGGDVCHVVKSAQKGVLPQCQARFVSDTVPVLLLLDATLTLLSSRGERTVPLATFYEADGIERFALAKDEVLIAITLPAAPELHAVYEKLCIRETLDFPSLGIALAVQTTGDTVTEIRCAMTGIGTHPGHWRAHHKAHDSVAEMMTALIAHARNHASVYDQDFFPRDYRKRMIEVFIKKAWQRLGGAQWA